MVAIVWMANFHASQCSNILVVNPLAAGSHEFILRGFLDFMTSRGHNVTIVRFETTNDPKFSNSSMNVINMKALDKDGSCSNFVTPDGKFDVGLKMAEQFWNFDGGLSFVSMDMFCRYGVQCETLLDRDLYISLKATNFDVAIVDILVNGCGVALAKALELPIASFWVYSFIGWDASLTPAQSLPSIVPTSFTGLPEEMSFLDRVQNFVALTLFWAYRKIYYSINQSIVSQKFPHLPPVCDMVHDIDIHLVIPNFLTTTPKLTPPNVFAIGGPHLRAGQPLPEVSVALLINLNTEDEAY